METTISHILWYPGHELLRPDIVRADNCYLYDSSRKKYVDLESGVWCTPLGHNNPRITRILTEQAAQISHTGFNYSSPIVENAAKKVLALLEIENGVCVFLCSGSEAVEYGVRVAQSFTDRPLLMTMTDSYFGAYGSAAARESDQWYCFDWTVCAGCDDKDTCDSRCEQFGKIPFERIGGFLFEPGSSSGLVRFPPKKLIQALVATIKEDNGLLLVNEVTTGVGRTGQWFGFQHYDISPDVIAMGKGIGNGYPVSVAAFGPEIAKALRDQPLNYAQSHQNDPLGAAIVQEVIRVIHDDGLVERTRALGKQLADGLTEIAAGCELVKAIRSRGLMAAVELNDDPECTLTIRVHRQLLQRGYIVGRRVGVSVLRIDPSLTIDPADIDGFLATFSSVLGAEI
ncbi:MAG: aspartate aminotransferase family protein [candidate division Zixibacteria bacterium]|nr:aspartate aminotransferase family protein [candidate division Zixibacteria bacterium]MDH3936116.1 aspartate aminotransferase family protein [candidate division Zixibacteria bacterium]MDH4032639.1 aspartate aminotransferase family protein [candidate division Zixibacteria bacterium]